MPQFIKVLASSNLSFFGFPGCWGGFKCCQDGVSAAAHSDAAPKKHIGGVTEATSIFSREKERERFLYS